MDDDGFTLHSRRRGRSYQEPGHDRGRANFQSEVPRYAGTSEEFEIAHFTRYGREEGLSSPGDHYNVSYQFPQGSDREKLYKHYHASTNKKKIARRAYENGFTAAKNEYQSMNEAEKRYYKNHTDGLTPEQHERLDPRAKDLRDKCER